MHVSYTQLCTTNADRYKYTITSAFSNCTAPCNGGTQTRTAFCTDTLTNQIIPGSQCPNMPILQQACNTQQCTGQSGPCNATCGTNAYLTRQVACFNANDAAHE